MKIKRKLLVFGIVFFIFFIIPITHNTIITQAHSGRTDGNGGHRDNKNKSGLGSYHFHCGGHPAHLHINGACPYAPKDIISVSDYDSIMYVGDSDDFSYSIKSENLYVKPTIISSNPNVVSVSGTTLKAESIGTATISVSTSSATKTFTITVKEIMPESLNFTSTLNTLQVGETLNTTIAILPSNTTNKHITYSSSNKNVAEVSPRGAVKGKSSGSVIITATTSNGISKDIQLKVFEVIPDSIKCNDELNIIVGDEIDCDIMILPENSNNKDFTVTIEDESLLSYSGGSLNAIKEGNTVIHIETWNGIAKDVPVNIGIVPVESISVFDNTNYVFLNFVDIDSDLLIETSVKPHYATYTDIVYKTSNPQVVDCVDGNLSIKGIGKATITCVAYDNIYQNISIIVVNKTIITMGIVLAMILTAIIIYRIVIIKKKYMHNKQ